MRIRSIKPDFWRSEAVTALEDWGDRLLFIGLWSYVDDNGVGLDRIALITADLFADDVERDAGETFARVSRGLRKLAELGRIVRYTIDGKDYLFVNGWGEHQRIDHPNEARFPLPDGEIAHPARPNTVRSKASRKPRETRARTSRLEQGNRGTGEQGNRGTDDDPLPPEPPFDPGAEPNTDVVVTAPPTHITANTRPAKRHPSSAAMTVVRLALGPIGADGYPRSTHERLAVVVEKLAAEGHHDTVIRQALTEWDRRPDCVKPEYLPTVLSDVIKASRASPESNPHDAKVNSFLAFAAPREQQLEIQR